MTKSQQHNYIPTIGIECHVQLKTRTKLFSAVGNDARGADPNTLISHIDLGMPGALPVLNKEAVNMAMKMAFAFNTKPQRYSHFERKHYFYPDLPKGYQITQLSHPIIVGGFVEVNSEGRKHKVHLNRVQLEEDAGKNIHPTGKDYSLVDLNRAGTPLLEIVSEPEIGSAIEAKAYARELYLLVRYLDVSDADLYHGNMRFDVNVSVSKDHGKLGTRTETKNLNSFRSVEKAVEYEINRQTELLEKGGTITQETRGWDDAKQKTFSQRGKEEAHDYRYMPEPDIPPVVLSQAMIDLAGEHLPLLPHDYRQAFDKLDLEPAAIEVLVGSPASAVLVNQVIEQASKEYAKRVANWIVNQSSKPNEDELQEVTLPVTATSAISLSELVAQSKLSSSAAKEVWVEMMKHGGDPLKIAESKNLLQVSDEAEIAEIVTRVLAANPAAAEDVKNGETKVIGFLVGQVMKASAGKANPGLAQKLIKKQLRR